MANNHFNWYVWLIDTIQRYGHIALSEISRKWHALADDEACAHIAIILL